MTFSSADRLQREPVVLRKARLSLPLKRLQGLVSLEDHLTDPEEALLQLAEASAAEAGQESREAEWLELAVPAPALEVLLAAEALEPRHQSDR